MLYPLAPAYPPLGGYSFCMKWFVYILECADGTLYCGVTTDVARRVAEHNGTGKVGAKYTKVRRPVKLVYQEPAESRSAAQIREHQIKSLTREEKQKLISKHN